MRSADGDRTRKVSRVKTGRLYQFAHRAMACPGLVSNQRPPSRQDGVLPLNYQGLGAGPGFEPGNLWVMSPARFHNCAIPQVGRPGLEPGTVGLKVHCTTVVLAAHTAVSRPRFERGAFALGKPCSIR